MSVVAGVIAVWIAIVVTIIWIDLEKAMLQLSGIALLLKALHEQQTRTNDLLYELARRNRWEGS